MSAVKTFSIDIVQKWVQIIYVCVNRMLGLRTCNLSLENKVFFQTVLQMCASNWISEYLLNNIFSIKTLLIHVFDRSACVKNRLLYYNNHWDNVQCEKCVYV